MTRRFTVVKARWHIHLIFITIAIGYGTTRQENLQAELNRHILEEKVMHAAYMVKNVYIPQMEKQSTQSQGKQKDIVKDKSRGSRYILDKICTVLDIT